MTTTDTRPAPLTDQQLAEIEENASYFAARTHADLHQLVGQDVPALLANLKQARRGAQELWKTVVFLTELIKDAYVRGADDPVDALQMLGNCLAEVFEDEGGLSVDEYNRVCRALVDRRAEAKHLQAVRELHSPFRVYDDCCHEHKETDKNVTDVAEIGIVCEDGYLYTVCRHCCLDAQGFQTEACVSEHDHSGSGNRNGFCPTRRALGAVQADAWVVPKVPVDDNPHVRPYIRGGLIYRYASDAETPEQARRYAAQLLAAADEADARTKETGQ